MRTWVLLSCLAICLLVVSARQRAKRDALSSRVTKELLEKLLQVKREEIKKSSNKASSLRERIGRVVQNVHQLQDKKKRELQKKENQQDEAMTKLLNLLKKKLTVRQGGPGPSGQNEVPKQKNGQVLGQQSNQNTPQVKDAIEKQPKKSRESSETVEFDDPIFGLEGGDVIEIDDTSELVDYVALEMLASRKFCATPVDEGIIDELGEDLESVANDIITAMENTISGLQAANYDATQVVQVVVDEFFGGFEDFGEKLEETARDTMVMLYRYILYGTEDNTHCEIGDWFYSWEFDYIYPVNDSYDRLWCLENGLYFFNFFIADPFNPLWSDVDEEDIAAWEARRCNNASELLWDAFPGEPELETMVDTVIIDLECIANKLKDAIDDEEVVERNLKRRDLNETADPMEDPIANSIEGFAAIVTEVLVDITELMYTLIFAERVDHTQQLEDRAMLRTIYKMAKRHHK